jgi:hypothetical protein
MYVAGNLRVLSRRRVEFVDLLSDRQLPVDSYYCSYIRCRSGSYTSIYNALRLDFDKHGLWAENTCYRVLL